MSTLDDARRRIFSVPRQIASVDVRRKALATLREGDVVRAVDVETGEPIGDRRLACVDRVRALMGVGRAEWPIRYTARLEGTSRDWRADDDGRQLNEAFDVVPGGWVLVAPWVPVPQISEPRKRRVPFTWGLYERHMKATWAAIVAGSLEMPEAPWEEN